MRRAIHRACVLGLAILAAPWAFEDEKSRDKIAIGKPAPVFRLDDHEGDVTTVGGETDHWTVLAFYPKAMTPG